jgi:hypothetical protein
MALLARLCSALLAVPLLLCSPILPSSAARRRRAKARRAAALIAEVAPTPRAPKRPPSAVVRGMGDDLRHELAVQAAEGRNFPNLARFQRQFSKGGLAALDGVPVDLLRRALREFEAMVRNWSSPRLADLRSRMAVTLAHRTSASSVWIAVNSVAPGARPEAMGARLFRHASSMFEPGEQLLSKI